MLQTMRTRWNYNVRKLLKNNWWPSFPTTLVDRIVYTRSKPLSFFKNFAKGCESSKKIAKKKDRFLHFYHHQNELITFARHFCIIFCILRCWPEVMITLPPRLLTIIMTCLTMSHWKHSLLFVSWKAKISATGNIIQEHNTKTKL